MVQLIHKEEECIASFSDDISKTEFGASEIALGLMLSYIQLMQVA